jgi:hypothetical protein
LQFTNPALAAVAPARSNPEIEEFVMASSSVTKTAPHARGPVRISLPASIAYNAEALKSTIASLVDRIGCRSCFSGADCHFSQERELSFDARGEFRDNPNPSPWRVATPQPSPWNVTVGFQGKAAFNIDQVYSAIDKINGQLGCLPCHSGFDVSYLNEVIFVGVGDDGQVRRYGATPGQ